jgi:glutamine synthetase
VEAMPALITDKARAVFEEQKVLSSEELEGRYHIGLEGFIKTINIEAAMSSNIGHTMILPAALEYQSKVAASISTAKVILSPEKFIVQTRFLEEVNEAVNRFLLILSSLDKARANAEEIDMDLFGRATFYQTEIRRLMDETRTAADALELIVEDNLWPLPKYREMLFLS